MFVGTAVAPGLGNTSIGGGDNAIGRHEEVGDEPQAATRPRTALIIPKRSAFLNMISQ